MNKIVTIIAIFMIGPLASGFVATRPNLHVGMEQGENCNMQSTQGSASQLNEINCLLNPESCLHRAAWFEDQDNEMIPVSTEEGLGAAMVTVATSSGVVQGVQVCEGVYLTTEHVLEDALQNLNLAEDDEDKSWIKLIHYPMHPDNMTEVTNETAQFTVSSGDGAGSDYMFIKVDQPSRPNSFIRPAQASNPRLTQLVNNEQIEVNLVRPQTRFNQTAKRVPDFNEETWAEGLDNIAPLYQNPMRVTAPCRVGIYANGLMGHSCPTEASISGSSLVSEIDGQQYLMGLHSAGRPGAYDEFDSAVAPNVAVQSAQFCEDYAEVCGEPCVNIDELIPPSTDTVSL